MTPPPPPASGYGSFRAWMAAADAKRGVLRGQAGAEGGLWMCRTCQERAFAHPATPDYSIHLHTEGSVELDADCGFGSVIGRVRAGTFYVAPPHTPIRLQSSRSPFQLLLLSVPHERVSERLRAMTGRDTLHLGETLHARMHHDGEVPVLVRMLWAQLQLGGPTADLAADGLVTAIFAQLLHLAASPGAPTHRPALCGKALQDTLGLMRARLESGIAVEELAAGVGVSSFHFSRLFKAAMGEPPHRHLNRLRVEHSQKLMMDKPYWTITAVALACGYTDQGHLARHFRAFTGGTPTAWRSGVAGQGNEPGS